MNTLALVVLVGWPLLALVLFLQLPLRRAVIASLVAGWLLLPPIAIALPGFPDWTKPASVGLGALLGLAVVAFGRLGAFRLRWFDLPMLVWIASPMAASVSNGLGAYDGASAVVGAFLNWGVPYWIGRTVLGDAEGIRLLLKGMFIGALVYAPLCLFENRMSAQLGPWVYGIGGGWRQHEGFGSLGWRPNVFMHDSLTLTLYMGCAALGGIWLWRAGQLGRAANVKLSNLLIPSGIVALLCKSLGATALWVGGLGLLWTSVRMRTQWLLIGLLLVAPAYIITRGLDLWSGETITEWVSHVSADRAQSFQFRLDNEKMLIDKALERPWLGWGGWGRSRVYDRYGKDISITDGLWIIALGSTGVVGTAGLFGALLMPGYLLLRRVPPRLWADPAYAPLAAMAVICTLYAIDCLPNGMLHPLFVVGGGAVVSALGRPMPAARDRVRSAPESRIGRISAEAT